MAHRKLAIIRRRLFTALSVLSLLLCVATLALWVRSYFRSVEISYSAGTDSVSRAWWIRSIVGEVDFYHSHNAGREAQPPLGWQYLELPAYRANALKSLQRRVGPAWFLGFGTLALHAPGSSLRAYAVPHWFLALLFAILPALHLRAAIRSRRRDRAGHCPRCGYDLRATPERCPECGTERVLATDGHR